MRGGSLWVKIFPISDGENNNGVILRYGSGGTWFLLLSDGSDGKTNLRFIHLFSENNGQWDTTSKEIILNSWNQIGINYDSGSASNNPNIYINGNLVSLTKTDTPLGTRISSSGELIYVGNRPKLDLTFDGKIDDIGIYNRELSPSEVSYNFANGKQPCEIEEIECIDSDGGKNYYVKGTTNNLPGMIPTTQTDYCRGDSLIEMYCADVTTGAFSGGFTYDCPNGCSDGACILSSNEGFGLSEFPSPFIQACVLNNNFAIVVGDSAPASDTIAAASFIGAIIVHNFGFNVLFYLMISLSIISMVLAMKYRKSLV